MQSIFYFTAKSLYMFRVPSTPIIRSTWISTICSLYFILLQNHSTCFGCRPHPSSGVHEYQQYPVYILFYWKITLHVSGAVHIHHQEYMNINNIQSINYFTAKSLYMFRVPSTFIIRSTWICNYSFRYKSYCKIQRFRLEKIYKPGELLARNAPE